MNVESLANLAVTINHLKLVIGTTGSIRITKNVLAELRAKLTKLELEFINGVLEDSVSPADIQKQIAQAKKELEVDRAKPSSAVVIDEDGKPVVVAEGLSSLVASPTYTDLSSKEPKLGDVSVQPSDSNVKSVVVMAPKDEPQENLLSTRLAEEKKKVAAKKAKKNAGV